MDANHPHSTRALLEQLGWINALAQRLCADSGHADDLGQDVALQMLVRPPTSDVPLRAWITTVLRNRLRQGHRGAARRAHREQRAAQSEVQPSAAELVERASIQRHVVDAVLALKEPYRNTILQRYFDDCSPAEIALRDDVPVETVKTRLKRGIAMLREQLDADHGGDGRAWAVALMTHLPLNRGAAGAAATGASIMTLKQLLLPAAVAVAAIVGAWQLVERDSAEAPEPELAAERADVELAPVEEQQDVQIAFAPAAGEPRISFASSPSAEVEPSVAAAVSRALSVEALVVDLESRPVAGVDVHLVALGAAADAYETLGTTDTEGRIAMELETESGFLRVDNDEWTTVFEGSLQAIGASAVATVVVAPPRDVEGRVVDTTGRAIADASVTLDTREPLSTRLDVAVNVVTGGSFETTTDSAGVFRFEAVPEFPGSRLSVDAAGYAVVEESIAERGSSYTEVVVTEGVVQDGMLFGRVVDAGGTAVRGAWVSLGGESRASDATGRFSLPTDDSWAGDVVRAVLPGFLPAEVHKLEDGNWPDPLVLQLGLEPLTLAGVVEYEDGTPAAGKRVKLHNSTPFGLVAPEAGQAGEWVLNSSGGSPWMRRSAESLIGGQNSVLETVTDENGRFLMSGLLDIDYLLIVNDPETLRGNSSEWVRAGRDDVTVVLANSPMLERVAGRVIDGDGEPLAQVRVGLQRNINADYAEFPTASFMGMQVETDKDGRFELGPVAEGGVVLSVVPGAGYPFKSLDVADFDDPTEIEVVLTAMASFFVDLGARPELADAMQLLDERGEALFLQMSHGMGSFAVDEGSFADGRTPVYAAPSGKRTIVLYKSGEEVERRAVQLTPGDVASFEF